MYGARLRDGAEAAPGPLPGGGLVVCALDTELLGHWWYEGVAWLAAVVEEAARQGLELVRLDEAVAAGEPRPLPVAVAEEWRPVSWGAGGDLSTWSSPGVAELAFGARAAELRGARRPDPRSSASALRELLALQASDWAFLITPRARRQLRPRALRRPPPELARALSGEDPAGAARALRNIAPDARPSDLLAP